MTKNMIAFLKGIVVPPNDEQNNRQMVATVNAELMRFGFMLTEKAFEALSKADPLFIKGWIKEVADYLMDLTGDGVRWKPLHKGFPKTVIDSSILELYMDAILHYWTDGNYYPNEELVKEGYEFEYVQYTMVKLGTEEEFNNIFTTLVSVNNSLTPRDMRVIEWFTNEYSNRKIEYLMPSSIPFKENLTVLAAKGLPVPIKTPTDVLRIAHYLSGNKTDLIIPPKTVRASQWSTTQVSNPDYLGYRFGPFTRAQRRYILSLLNKAAYAEEMVTRLEMWKRLGEVLHPGEYKDRYSRAYKAFDAIRNTKVRSWKGKVELAFRESYDKGIAKLAERPGEFARRLDSLLRQGPGADDPFRVLTPFRECAIKVSNKVLFELLDHFKKRNNPTSRTVWIKGARRPTDLPVLAPMSEELIEAISATIWAAISDKFAMLEPLGKIWLDEELKTIPIPSNMRSASESLVQVIRGQRIPLLAEKEVIRLYLHWTKGWDLDLSCEFLDKDGRVGSTCSYHNLRPFPGVYHSGDVIPHSDGNHAEYIDLHIDTLVKDQGQKWAVMVAHTFRGNGLKAADSHMGIMERDTVDSSGRGVWRPETLSNAVQLESEAMSVAMVLIDLETREWIWIDQDLNAKRPISTGNVVKDIVAMYAELPEISAWHILRMHAEARGTLVVNREDADTVFALEDFNKSYENLLTYML